MPNPNPKLSNLTRAGMGRPRKGLVRVQFALTPELIQRLAEIQQQQFWDRNYTVEQYLRLVLGLPTDYNATDLRLIAKGAPID